MSGISIETIRIGIFAFLFRARARARARARKVQNGVRLLNLLCFLLPFTSDAGGASARASGRRRPRRRRPFITRRARAAGLGPLYPANGMTTDPLTDYETAKSPDPGLAGAGLCARGKKGWQRATLPHSEVQYHCRRGPSRPCSGWERVLPPRHGHQPRKGGTGWGAAAGVVKRA